MERGIFVGLFFGLCFYFVFNVKDTPHSSKELCLVGGFFPVVLAR